MKFNRVSTLTVGAVLCGSIGLAGCAHPIRITPGLSPVLEARAPRIDKRVGLVISAEDLQREVATAGGAGNKVSYLPYRELQSGLQVALGQVFAAVVRIDGPNDPRVASERLNLIVVPVVTTQSSSTSLLVWPPAAFTITLDCKVFDAKGQPVTVVQASGSGRAGFDEFKTDFGLAGSRAADDVLRNLVKALSEAAALKG